MWYRTSKANQNQLNDNSPMSSINNASIKENLIAAIKNRDPIATQTAYRSWKRTISLSEEDDALLRNEIAKMNSAIIGSDKDVIWDDKTALKLIVKAKVQQPQAGSALAQL